MSVEDRDYWREPPDSGGPIVRGAPKWMISIGTGLAFIAQAAAENADPDSPIPIFVGRHLGLSGDGLARGEVWQALTYALLHSGVFHLFWNMAALVMLLSVLEERLDAPRVYALYAVGAVGGAAGHALWVVAGLSPSSTVVVGASGAVTGVFAAAVVLMGRKRLDFFGVLSIPVWVLGVVYIGWDLVAAILFVVDPRTFDSGVAVQAHLGGAIAGAAMWWRPRRAGGPRRAESRALARDEASRAAREDGEAARVDALLERIHQGGIGALTEEERAFLKRVSSRYRR